VIEGKLAVAAAAAAATAAVVVLVVVVVMGRRCGHTAAIRPLSAGPAGLRERGALCRATRMTAVRALKGIKRSPRALSRARRSAFDFASCTYLGEPYYAPGSRLDSTT